MSSQKKNGDKQKQGGKKLRARNRDKGVPLKKVRVGKDRPDNSIQMGDKKTPDMLLVENGAQGTNIESAAVAMPPAGDTDLVPGTSSKINQQLAVSGTSFAYCAIGIVLRAIRNGWIIRSGIRDYPYHAWRYLYDAMISATAGSVDTITAAPLWWWEFLTALKPKEGKFKTGRVLYSLTVTPPVDGLDPEYEIGVPSGIDGSVIVFFGTPTTATVNGYSVLAPPVDAYTAELGAAAVSNMWSTFANNKNSRPLAQQDLESLTMRLEGDTSAFAAVYAELGQSYSCPCGIANTYQSERYISAPILSKFCLYQDPISAFYRGFHEYRHGAGGPSYVLTRMSEFRDPDEVFNKVSPVFKFYDFEQYFTQVTTALSAGLENWSSNTLNAINSYPLTAQQFRLMLRQTLLPIFSNEMGLELKYSFSGSEQAATFLPYSVGPNGYSLAGPTTEPLFPQFFVEGARAAKRITAELKGPQGTKGGIIDIIPILGSYYGGYATNPTSQWTWVNQQDGTANPFFADPAGELPIDMWNAYYFDGTNTSYLDLNGNAYNVLVQLHNKWISGYTNVFTGLSTIGSERGLSILSASDITSITLLTQSGSEASAQGTTPTPVQGKGQQKTIPTLNVTKASKRVSVKAPKHLGLQLKMKIATNFPNAPNYTASQGITHYTSNLPPLSIAWKYKQQVICPVYWVGEEAFDGTLAEYQVQQMEPHYVALASTSEGPYDSNSDPLFFTTIFDKNYKAGLLDVKSPTGESLSEMERDLNELGKHGRGGFFTDLACTIAKGIGELTGW